MNYGFFPKGLLPFHRYGDSSLTPFAEHLKEAGHYASSAGKARLHFTISDQHDAMFRDEQARVQPEHEAAMGVRFEVGYSNQKPSTDTLAVDLQNRPFRLENGSMLFRPGGHGALIENLNDQDADIIFIKNIDNVVVDAQLDGPVTEIGRCVPRADGVRLRREGRATPLPRAGFEHRFDEDPA